jgi:RNA polymerase sigma-70 factor (ECF subfamily)
MDLAGRLERSTVMGTTHDMPPPHQPVIPGSFDRFYRDNYPNVVGLVYSLTGSRHGAEDLAQEAFLRAYRRWDHVGGYDRPHSWVRVVAMNLARSRLRRLGAEARALRRFVGMDVTAFPEMEPSDERFWAEVRRLPPRQRQVVVLHYVDDAAVADIARTIGISESGVKNSLAQARNKLARTLEVEP